jgi:alpha-L-arabinofuranosidase
MRTLVLLAVLSVTVAEGAVRETAKLAVDLDKPGVALNRGMWGIFFEDINFGADGGMYAELVKNRGFEFPDPLMGWFTLHPQAAPGSIAVRDDSPAFAKNPHYVRIECAGGKQPFGLASEGFRGIGVKAGEAYNFSAQVRAVAGKARLRVELYSSIGERLDGVTIEEFGTQWQKRTAALHPKTTDAKARLHVLLEGAGTLDLDMISLFPENTWKNRPGGLRADMVQMLADLRPGFMRFPGGCIVEGFNLSNRYQWKKTLGPVEDRELMINRWNMEFLHRPAPDYFQSYGLGFYEYFQLCEDIGAEPLPILGCGLACQFNTGEACPLDRLDPFIQDALDLVEFANGPADSPWGARRAAMGRPAPFGLKMIGVGNENWEQPYLERYARFHEVLKARHPEIQLVSSAGPGPDGGHFRYAWPKLRELRADIVDEHCYNRPDWFFKAAARYDGYERTGPRVFFGEYAAQSDHTCSVHNRGTLECALAEAACMTGLERNGDVVRLASYAPLFAHVDAWQWKPDMIWVDNLTCFGTPSYQVQKLFANNPGDETVPVRLEAADGSLLFASATRDRKTGETILKVVNAGEEPAPVAISLAGGAASQARALTLTGGNLQDENSFEKPLNVAPKESTFQIAGASFTHEFPARSLTVLRIGRL